MAQEPIHMAGAKRTFHRLLAASVAAGVVAVVAIVIAVRATVERDSVRTELDSTYKYLHEIEAAASKALVDHASLVRVITMLAEQSLDSSMLQDLLPDEHARNNLMRYIEDQARRMHGTSILSVTLKETESALRSTALLLEEQTTSARRTIQSQSDSLQRLANELQLLRHALDSASAQLTSRMQSYQKLTFTKNGARVTYLGDVRDGMANGFGTGLWNTGGTYEGLWQNNMRHGHGIYVWADGEKYEGSFINGKRSGYGVYTFKNGERYLGEWLDDKRHGKGVHLRANGDTVVVGVWVADRFKERQRAPLHAD